MTLGLEQPIIYLTGDIFDPQAALMALAARQLYINLLKDDYKDTMDQLKNFNTKYGDFYSPFAADNQRYYDLTQKPIQNFLNNVYSNGQDPLRSVEGRSMIQRLVASVPGLELANLKRSAEAGKEYLKAKGVLESKGMYDPELLKFYMQQMGLPDWENWDTAKNGVWNLTSPLESKSLHELTADEFDKMKPTYIKTENGYQWSGITLDMLDEAAKGAAPGLASSVYGLYYLDKARLRVRSANPGATDEQIESLANAQYLKDIANSHKHLLEKTPKADEWAMLRYKEAQDNYRAQLAASRKGKDGSGDDDEKSTSILDNIMVNGVLQTAGGDKLSSVLDKYGLEGALVYAMGNARLNLRDIINKHTGNSSDVKYVGRSQYSENKKSRDKYKNLGYTVLDNGIAIKLDKGMNYTINDRRDYKAYRSVYDKRNKKWVNIYSANKQGDDAYYKAYKDILYQMPQSTLVEVMGKTTLKDDFGNKTYQNSFILNADDLKRLYSNIDVATGMYGSKRKQTGTNRSGLTAGKNIVIPRPVGARPILRNGKMKTMLIVDVYEEAEYDSEGNIKALGKKIGSYSYDLGLDSKVTDPTSNILDISISTSSRSHREYAARSMEKNLGGKHKRSDEDAIDDYE